MTRLRAILFSLVLLLAVSPARAAEFLLIPMDLQQTNHLRAYGVAFHTLQAGDKVNWLLKMLFLKLKDSIYHDRKGE